MPTEKNAWNSCAIICSNQASPFPLPHSFVNIALLSYRKQISCGQAESALFPFWKWTEKLGWLITGHPGCSNCLRDEQRSRPGQLKTSLGFLFDLLEKRHAIFSGITSCKNKIHWELLAANFAYKWDKPVWGTCWPEIKREHRRSRIQGEMEKISFASLWYHLHPGSNSAWSQPPGLP